MSGARTHEAPSSDFDEFASNYDHALDQGLRVSGEDKSHFAIQRIRWLAGRLQQLDEAPASVMDFGCGTGSTMPFIYDLLHPSEVIGVDVSQTSLDVARHNAAELTARFMTPSEYDPCGELDLVYCNGVFHHIEREKRPAAVRYIASCLRPGGLWALWENNAWNPGTKLVMSRIPFDRDAITLTAAETRRLLQAAGFEILQTDFLFIFPRMLRMLRFLEPPLARLPLGAQYMVLARKTSSDR